MNEQKSLVVKFADRYSVDAGKLMATLSSTAFKQRDGGALTNEQMMALLVVADQYRLNPFTKEIYAFPDKANGIIPVVGVDGWSRIINSDPNFDGMEFRFSDKNIMLEGMTHEASEWVECLMYRKDRSRPIVVREYLQEVYRKPFSGKYGAVTGPWQTHTNRFLRHKAMIQCARLAFGFVGIYDQDEAERIGEANTVSSKDVTPKLPELPQEKLVETCAAITNGMTDSDTAISMLSTKFTLTDADSDALMSAKGVIIEGDQNADN